MAEEIVILNVYKSQVSSIKYVFKDGREACFVNGIYRTADAAEIEELDKELSGGRHPILYIDKAEKTIESNRIDPMAVLRENIIAEYLAEQAALNDPTRDMGNTKQEPVKPASTADVGAAAAGGDGSASAAALTGLAARLAKVTVDSDTGSAVKK